MTLFLQGLKLSFTIILKLIKKFLWYTVGEAEQTSEIDHKTIKILKSFLCNHFSFLVFLIFHLIHRLFQRKGMKHPLLNDMVAEMLAQFQVLCGLLVWSIYPITSVFLTFLHSKKHRCVVSFIRAWIARDIIIHIDRFFSCSRLSLLD